MHASRVSPYISKILLSFVLNAFVGILRTVFKAVYKRSCLIHFIEFQEQFNKLSPFDNSNDKLQGTKINQELDMPYWK